MAAANEQPLPSGSQPPDKITSALPSYPAGLQPTPPSPPIDPTAITAAREAIILPPHTSPEVDEKMTPRELAQLAGRLDVVLVAIVLALAALVACFSIRNSDFLMHLATGRYLAENLGQGQFAALFGQEPFSHTTDGVYWVNHSWLYDLILYSLFLLIGGVGLVLIKAGLITLLAGVLLQIRRHGQTLWAPAVCTGLALLAISPRLLFQPIIVSYLFLGLTLWLLTTRGQAGRKRLWALVPLFVLWVNMDSWFVLGPLTVGLFLLGEILQESLGPDPIGVDARQPEDRRTLIAVLIVGVLACLINPHHIYAFAIPSALPLTEPGATLKNDPYFGAAYISPFSSSYFEVNIGLSVAGLSYFVLVAAGLASFALNGEPGSNAKQTGWRWWRGLVWLAFLLLSAYHARAIPFFAVVAAPITALNLQDYVARVLGTEMKTDDRWKLWSLGGRAVTLIAGVALLLLAWPGWLQAVPRESRRVRLVGLELDPSLQKVAETVSEWRRQNLLRPDERGLNLTPDVANYYAWFCPTEKGFLDHRGQPFSEAVRSYVDLREAFTPDEEELDKAMRGIPSGKRGEMPWQQTLRDRGVKYVVLHRVPLKTTLWVMSDPDQWVPLYMDGRTTIVGWSDPAAPRAADSVPFAELRFDPQRRAFGPKGVAVEAPRERVVGQLEPPPREWWERYLYATPPSSLYADETDALLQYYTLQSNAQLLKLTRDWQAGFAAGLVGAAVPTPGAGGSFNLALYRLPLARAYMDPTPGRRSEAVTAVAKAQLEEFRYRHDDGPPGLPWLALRAARQAVHDRPSDPQVYLRLQAAYATLHQTTRERSWGNQFPLLIVVRRIQLCYALKQALALDPDLESVHAALAGMYEQQSFRDLELKHRDEMLRLSRDAGPRPNEKPDDFQKRIEALEKYNENLKKGVETATNEFEVAADKKPKMMDKLQLALQYGLPDKAIELLQPNKKELSPDEIRFALELRLQVGELDEVREVLTEQLKDIGPIRYRWDTLPAYEWFQFLLAAGSGDYQRADELLQRIEDQQRPIILDLFQGQALNLFPLSRLELPQTQPLAALALQRLQQDSAIRRLLGYPFGRVQQADLYTLRGMIALESGDTERARQRFETARDLGSTPVYPTYSIATHFLEQLQGK